MSYKGIKFNGKEIIIPKEYVKSVNISDKSLVIESSNGEKTTFAPPIVDSELSKSSNNAIKNRAVATKFEDVINNIIPNKISSSISETINSEINIEAQKNFRTLGLLGKETSVNVEKLYPLKEYNIDNLSEPYGFELNENGYYESNNKGVNNSYALCKINFIMNEAGSVEFEAINYAESGYDYGSFSVIDKTLTSLSNSTSDVGLIYQDLRNTHSANATRFSYSIPAGEHFITVKYLKDSSQNSNNDSLQFKITTPYGSYVETITEPLTKTITMSDEDKMQFNGENVATESFVEEKLAGVGGSGGGGSSSGSSSGGIKEYVPTSASDLLQFLATNKHNILSVYLVFNSNVSATYYSYEKIIEGEMTEAEAEAVWDISTYPIIRGNSYNYGYKLYPSIHYDGSNVEGNLKLTCSAINGFLDFYVRPTYMNCVRYQFPDVYFDEEGEIKNLAFYNYDEAPIPEESINYALCKVCYY